MRRLLLLSGPLSIGKTAVARELIDAHGFRSVRTGPYLAELAKRNGGPSDRTALQALGDKLDEETDFQWIVDQVADPAFHQNPAAEFWLLDSVRKKRQVEHLRDRYRSYVHHAHLTAPEALLRDRYNARLASGGDYVGNIPYETAINHPNEISARSLDAIADIVIEVSGKAPEEIAPLIMRGFGGTADASGGTR